MQNRAYALENMVFCDWFWPIDFTANTETGVGDPELEARLFSAVTGLDMGGRPSSGQASDAQTSAVPFTCGRGGAAGLMMFLRNLILPLPSKNRTRPSGCLMRILLCPEKMVSFSAAWVKPLAEKRSKK